MSTLVLLASLWLLTGWLGWRVGILWWVQTTDMTRGDRKALRWLLVAGPINLAVTLSLLIEDARKRHRTPNYLDEIIYPRKDQT